MSINHHPADDTLLHQHRTDAEGCICIVAIEGGLRLAGWLGAAPFEA
jgi:anti-sigma factor ChrR (cupin superfamily)